MAHSYLCFIDLREDLMVLSNKPRPILARKISIIIQMININLNLLPLNLRYIYKLLD